MSVIVIGSGINGLVAAAELAIRGHAVTVLERLDRPGGAVRTEELTLPGFRHDVAAMNLSMFAGSAFHRTRTNELAQHGLELIPVNRPFASAFPDGTYIGVSTQIEDTLATLTHKEDRATWQELAAAFPQQAAPLGTLLGSGMKPSALAGTVWRIWREHGTQSSLELLQMLLTSPRQWVEKHFRDPRLQTALATWGMHLDFAPDIAGGAIFPYLESFGSQTQGMVIGKGGADTVTRSLIKIIESRSGIVRCNTEVNQILHNAKGVTGVQLSSGEIINADTVIANLAPSRLCRLLPQGTSKPSFDQGMQRFRHAPGTMMIHLALKDLPPWRNAALRQFAYVHLAPNLETISRTYQQAVAGLLPDEPILVVGQPTVFDPSRAPAGQHTLWVQVRCLPATIRGDAGGSITGRDWADIKDAYANRVLAMLERYAPGLSTQVLARHVVSPLDLEHENPNLVGGDQVGGSHHLSQNFLFRPVLGHADGRTPIRGLHMVGASVWPGAGTGAGSGYLVAQDL